MISGCNSWPCGCFDEESILMVLLWDLCVSCCVFFERERWRNMRCVQSNSCSANNFFLLVVHLWNKSHAHLRVNWHEHRRLENLGSADPVPCKLLLVPWRGECTHLRKVLSSPASEGILIGMPLAVPYLVPISMLPDVVEARAAGWTYFQASQRPGQKW